MNKRIAIIIVIVAVAISIIFIANYFIGHKKEKNVNQSVIGSQNSEVETKTEISAAEARKEIDECDNNEKDEALLGQCYQKVAVQARDEKICETITDRLFHEQCYRLVAKAKNDPELCRFIARQEDKDMCNYEVGKQTGDAKACGYIKIDPFDKDDCFLSAAVKKNDLTICQRIANSDMKNVCQGTISKDADRCASTKRIYEAIDCVSIIAIEKKDYKICDKLGDDRIRSCYDKYAKATNDVSVCPLISANSSASSSKDSCYSGIAINTNDVGLCEKILHDSTKDTCYKYISIQTNDLSLCDRIKRQVTKTECLNKQKEHIGM